MSAHRAAFRLTIVLAVTAALGQPPAGQNSRISGTVVNALSGQPLSHTQVAVGLPQNDAAQAMMTAEDGRFAFEKNAPEIPVEDQEQTLVSGRSDAPRKALESSSPFSTVSGCCCIDNPIQKSLFREKDLVCSSEGVPNEISVGSLEWTDREF